MDPLDDSRSSIPPTASTTPTTTPKTFDAPGTEADGSAAVATVVENPTTTRIGRIGWFAKGVVYLIAGLLAALVALRSIGWAEENASDEASPTGAIKEVAQHLFGGPLLIVLALGLLVYSGWRFVAAVMPGPKEWKARATRVGYVVSAVMYASFAFTAFKLVVHSPSNTDGNDTVSSIADTVMSRAGGRVIIGGVGLVLSLVGIYRANKGRKLDVTDELSLVGIDPTRRRWLRRVGAVGEVGRGAALGLIGFFLIRSAAVYEPEQATGLDGALRRAAGHGATRLLVPLISVGFISYGLFCLSTFRRRRFEAPT